MKNVQWKLLERDILDCFLEIVMKTGSLRCRKESTKEMWTANTTIHRFCRCNRFSKISTLLRFDDKATRGERKQRDKLAATGIWDMFVSNCQKSFEIYEHITIDQ